MKSDIDQLMQVRNIDALLVTGPGQHNPAMVYLTGIASLTQADLIKRRGEAPVLFHHSMERDEAAKSGLKTKCFDDYQPQELIKQAGGDLIEARVMRYQKMLEEMDITNGRVALYGKVDAGEAFATFDGIQKAIPALEFIGEADDSLLLQAMLTKDEDEVERIRRMGQITVEVVARTAEYLTSHAVCKDILVKKNGQPLTIGDVKSQINLWLAERGAENPEGMTFSIARDAAVPHSSGNSDDVLQLGKTIVYDIYPCEAGGGYYYDLTRTWCLGYAPDQVFALYEDVHAVFETIIAELKPGVHCPEYQKRACDLFEERGHPTVRSNPTTEVGYVHRLGHGVGLNIHERPWFGANAKEDDNVQPGSVFTIEPGLYYPDKGMGVRLEDTVWVRPDGKIEALAEYPLDLVLPVGKK